MHKWHVFDTFDQASKAAANLIATKMQSVIEEKNICHVVLPGGNSPKSCFSYLSEKNLPWEKVHWYLGDERCYPKDHPERNDTMIMKNLWSKISKTNIHPIPAELGAEEGAEHYRKLMDQVGNIDIAFLGMGEDGHTASLFPGNEALNNLETVVPVFNSPKPPDARVSLGLNLLKRVKSKIILTGGEGKAKIIARIKSGDDLPVNRLGDINWFLDKKAYGQKE